MNIPDRLAVGVTGASPADGLDAVEVSYEGDLPGADEVRALAGDRIVTLLGWHVITHRRADRLYEGMRTPIPAHAAVGHFERSRWTDEAWQQTDALARAVDAQAVLLQTPASFRSSAEHATRLENFVAAAMRPGLAIAWEWTPGSWPDAKALALCEHVGVVPVVDPATSKKIPDGEYVYLRFRGGTSGRKALRDDDLKETALAVRDRIGWVVFANATAHDDARRFAAML